MQRTSAASLFLAALVVTACGSESLPPPRPAYLDFLIFNASEQTRTTDAVVVSAPDREISWQLPTVVMEPGHCSEMLGAFSASIGDVVFVSGRSSVGRVLLTDERTQCVVGVSTHGTDDLSCSSPARWKITEDGKCVFVPSSER